MLKLTQGVKFFAKRKFPLKLLARPRPTTNYFCSVPTSNFKPTQSIFYRSFTTSQRFQRAMANNSQNFVQFHLSAKDIAAKTEEIIENEKKVTKIL